jgi:Flp pilus assembly protein TadG
MCKLSLLQDNRAQSLIELAFAFPIFIMLLFGAAEYGRLCYVGIEVTNAAHAGAQYGSQNRGTASDSAGIISTSINEAANMANLSVTPQQICAATYSDTPTTANCTTGAPAIVYLQVNTQATVASLFNSYGFGGSYTLHGQAIERVRQ